MPMIFLIYKIRDLKNAKLDKQNLPFNLNFFSIEHLKYNIRSISKKAWYMCNKWDDLDLAFGDMCNCRSIRVQKCNFDDDGAFLKIQ